MSSTPDQMRPGRGRRPAAVVRQAVLSGAGEMLFSSGLSEITFDKVAARAGVSKMTLYKWWPSPGALALDAYFAATETMLAFEDTGDIERDLKHQLHAFIALLRPAGHRAPVIAELVGAAQFDPDLAQALSERYTRPRRALAVALLEAARARRQIRDDIDLESIVDQLWGACYHRLLLPAQPLDTAFADTLVHNLLAGIGPVTRAGRQRSGC